MVALPKCVDDFVGAVTKLPGIRCVVVEDGEEPGVLHVSTSVRPLSDDVRAEIYRIEAETIQANPTLVFDFHVRCADEAGTVTPDGEGSHYFALWGGLDADPRWST